MAQSEYFWVNQVNFSGAHLTVIADNQLKNVLLLKHARTGIHKVIWHGGNHMQTGDYVSM